MGREILRVLPTLYDAATSDRKWPEALDAVVSLLGARGAILIAFDIVGLPFQVQKWCTTYDDADIQRYFTEFGHYEEAGQDLMRRGPAGKVFRDTDAWPDFEAVANRDDFVFLRERYGVEHRAGLCLTKGKGWNDMLALQVSKQWEHVTSDFWENLELARPHLAKVVEINRTFMLLRLRYQAVLGALDHIGIGMCIGMANGEILLSNAEAKRIFAIGDGLRIAPDGRLVARDEDVTRQVRAAVEVTVSTAKGHGNCEELSIRCPRTSEALPFLIEICPLRDCNDEIESDLQGCLICIIDPTYTRAISLDGLTSLFGLSPAQKSVCEELIRGSSAREIADMRGVSPETVRSQVKALYAKTGATNRVELIRLAIGASPPII